MLLRIHFAYYHLLISINFRLANTSLNNGVIFQFSLYDFSDRMWDIRDMGCLGCGIFEMWDVWDMGCL